MPRCVICKQQLTSDRHSVLLYFFALGKKESAYLCRYSYKTPGCAESLLSEHIPSLLDLPEIVQFKKPGVVIKFPDLSNRRKGE